MSLLSSDFLSRLEHLSLVSRRVFHGELMAQRRTKRVGHGIEFADHRPYAAGDDLRYLDWNLYARHNELLLRRFHEEEDLHVYLLLDCSRSMDFGSPSKFDLARQLTAALAYIALSDLDRIAVLSFADDIVNSFPLTRGKGQVLKLLQHLEQLTCRGNDTRLEQMTRRFLQHAPRRGLVLVLSDLFDPRGFIPALDVLRYNHYEPWVVQIHDPTEADPSLPGDVDLHDTETGRSRKLTVTESQKQRYRDRFEEFLNSVRRYCASWGFGCTIARTDVGMERLVLNMMRT